MSGKPHEEEKTAELAKTAEKIWLSDHPQITPIAQIEITLHTCLSRTPIADAASGAGREAAGHDETRTA